MGQTPQALRANSEPAEKDVFQELDKHLLSVSKAAAALADRRVLEGEEHIARQRQIVSRLEDLREPVTLQTARDLLRNMEHAQMLQITERDRLREFLGESS